MDSERGETRAVGSAVQPGALRAARAARLRRVGDTLGSNGIRTGSAGRRKVILNSHSQPVLQRPASGREASPAIACSSFTRRLVAPALLTAQAGRCWPHSAYRPNSSNLYPSALPVRAGAAALCPGRPARPGPGPLLARPFPYRSEVLHRLLAVLPARRGASFAKGALSAMPRTDGRPRRSAA